MTVVVAVAVVVVACVVFFFLVAVVLLVLVLVLVSVLVLVLLFCWGLSLAGVLAVMTATIHTSDRSDPHFMYLHSSGQLES